MSFLMQKIILSVSQTNERATIIASAAMGLWSQIIGLRTRWIINAVNLRKHNRKGRINVREYHIIMRQFTEYTHLLRYEQYSWYVTNPQIQEKKNS